VVKGKSGRWRIAKLAVEGKQNPWDQFPGHLRPYLRARVGKKKKNTSEGSGRIVTTRPGKYHTIA
jgi:hypothetical protein